MTFFKQAVFQENGLNFQKLFEFSAEIGYQKSIFPTQNKLTMTFFKQAVFKKKAEIEITSSLVFHRGR